MSRKPAPTPNPVDLPLPQPSPAPRPEQLLTVNDACRYLRCGRTRLYELMDRGRLSYLLDGERRRFTVKMIDDYVKSLPVVMGPALVKVG